MRVIAGKFRSRTLESVPGVDTRPTYDRLKETLFNVLQSSGKLEQARVLDLFAGTGSIGIEALSRGAASVCFVESNRAACRVIRKNIERLRIVDDAELLEMDVVDALAQLKRRGRQFDICFLDPPYRMQGAYDRTLRVLSSGDLISQDSLVVAEHDKRYDPGEESGQLRRYRLLEQGESSLSFYRLVSPLQP